MISFEFIIDLDNNFSLISSIFIIVFACKVVFSFLINLITFSPFPYSAELNPNKYSFSKDIKNKFSEFIILLFISIILNLFFVLYIL